MKGKRCYHIFCLALIIPFTILVIPTTAWSATFYVANESDLEGALDTAQQNGEDDTIIIAAGTYDVSGGIAVYVAKSTGDVENFALTIEGAGSGQTILDGGTKARGLRIITSTGVLNDSNANIVIRGITFKNGLATDKPDVSFNGGGLYIRTLHGNITIENTAFENNEANYDGGGLYVYSNTSGDVMVSGITASNNQSGGGGAGVYVYSGGNITVLDSNFKNNTVTGANTGGGLFAQSTTAGTVVTVMGCTFTGNEALATDAIAGGSYTETWQNNTTVFINNTLSGNSSVFGGGAYFNGGPMLVLNNTLSGNHAVDSGGGMAFEMQGGVATITNNIVWGNTADVTGADIMLWDGALAHKAVVNNNDYGILNMSGAGDITVAATNITLNPLFVSTSDPDPSNWDLHLRESSPAIDTGDNSLITNDIPTDRDGDKRVIDGNADATATVDMGSDEYVPPPPPPPPASNGGGSGPFGCSIRTNSEIDPLMPLMLLFSVFYLINRCGSAKGY